MRPANTVVLQASFWWRKKYLLLLLEKVGHQKRACLGTGLEEVNLGCEGINSDITALFGVCGKCQVKDPGKMFATVIRL